MATVPTRVQAQNGPESISTEEFAKHQVVVAKLKSGIEVGSRESISGARIVRIVRRTIMIRIVLQEVIPLSLLSLLLLYVAFFGF